MIPFFITLWTCFIVLVIMTSSVSVSFAQTKMHWNWSVDNKTGQPLTTDQVVKSVLSGGKGVCDFTIPNNPCTKHFLTKQACFKIKNDMINANNTANANFNNDDSNPLVPTLLDIAIYNQNCQNLTGVIKGVG